MWSFIDPWPGLSMLREVVRAFACYIFVDWLNILKISTNIYRPTKLHGSVSPLVLGEAVELVCDAFANH
ncbi:hypothetical protein EAF04_004142 [Stromatinia cepivora]|nr:hypothetical protein EAF04_004142 [Stromatinia cepivora]